MKPVAFSPAHTSPHLAELVCSNSLKSLQTTTATGVLKEELTLLGSLIMEAARRHAVPAGNALSVDRERFASEVTKKLANHPLVRVEHRIVHTLEELPDRPVILATGPLTHPDLVEDLKRKTDRDILHFYDATSPILYADSIDTSVVFRGSRYGKGGDDYLNVPLDRDQYERFVDAILAAEKVALHPFESETYYEGCMPIEVLAERGRDTLAFGPMKPVGLAHPETGRVPYAVVQLRAENLQESMYNLVGFQTKLTYSEQKRVFRTIPGLEQAEFVRLGSIHRNTFICAPELLDTSLQMKKRPGLFLAGQLSGVEGYVESAAMGLLAGINAARLAGRKEILVPPPATALGALIHHLTESDPIRFQPSNVNFGLFPPLEKKIRKRERGRFRSEKALMLLECFRVSLIAGI